MDTVYPYLLCKGARAVKKHLCLILSLLMMMAALPVTVQASGLPYAYIPNTLKSIKEQLPTLDTMPTMKLKNDEGEIFPVVYGDYDEITALHIVDYDGNLDNRENYIDVNGKEYQPAGAYDYFPEWGTSAFVFQVEVGPWKAIFSSQGAIAQTTKVESNTDYFLTGMPGNEGYVRFTYRRGNNGKIISYVSEICEKVNMGGILEFAAFYKQNGELDSYTVKYRISEDITYKIKYSPKNKPQFGWYEGTDAFGDYGVAYSNSLTTWRDVKTGKLTSQQGLEWDLYPLNAEIFSVPPRVSRLR